MSEEATTDALPAAFSQVLADYRRHLAALLGARAINQAFDNV